MPGMALSTLAVLNPQRTLAVRLGTWAQLLHASVSQSLGRANVSFPFAKLFSRIIFQKRLQWGNEKVPSEEQKKKRGYNSDFRNIYLILSWFMASCFLFLTGHKDSCFADDHGNSTRGTEWMREGWWELLREPICTWLGFNGAQDSSPGIHFFLLDHINEWNPTPPRN